MTEKPFFLTELIGFSHVAFSSAISVLLLVLFLVGIKHRLKKGNALIPTYWLRNLSIWIAFFGALSFVLYWLNTWVETQAIGAPKYETMIHWHIGSYGRLATYWVIALTGWTASLITGLPNNRK